MKQTITRRLTTLVGAALVAALALSGAALAATTPLAVTKTVPATNATEVSRTVNVKAYFNHDMRASTITSSTFKIKKQGATTWLSATRSVNNTVSPTSANGSSQSVITLNPNADLAANTTYQVVVVGGSSGVKDLNGNALGANKSWTFKTVTPPDTTIDPTTGPNGVVASTSASFAFSSSKPNSTFKCSLDGSTFAPCASPRDYPGPLSQGAHTFRVRAIDASGTEDPSPASRNWTVDTIAPNTSITAGPNDPSNNATPSLSFSSNETNSRFQCSMDGDTYSACTSPKDVSTLGDGPHTFSVKATDAAGNTDATEATYSWTVETTVDNVAPTVLNISPAHQSTGAAPSTNVTATFSEEMNTSSISGQTFKLFGAGTPVSAQVTYDQASRTATLNAAQDLEAGATYVARIIQDVHNQSVNVDGVKDLAGNTINRDMTWYFRVEAPPDVVTAAPRTLNLSPDVWCSPRQEWLTVTNRTPAPVTFASVSITGTDAAYFSDNARSYILNNGPFTVLSGNYFIDTVSFSLLPNGPVSDRHRSFQATLTYKDSTGATIGNPVELRSTTACLTVG